MTQLSVNVNKIATLRNARGKDLPNILMEAKKIIEFGAYGITVHPRPDGRHIRWPDVFDLKEHLQVELNIEGYPSQSFIDKVILIKPAQCTLVPDPPEVLTSNAGWNIASNEAFLEPIIKQLNVHNIRVSLFIDPHNVSTKELIALRDWGAKRIELYTESYAESFKTKTFANEIKIYQKIAQLAHSMGLGVNAGHDLNLDNLAYFSSQIPELKEVSIGHALVCDALNYGWQKTIELYLKCLK
jgi:pyridoxine 5-phosphate synthase